MEKEEKFFFNHYSLTSDDATNLLSTMIEGIKVFYLKKRLENTTFYFYTEMDNFWDFKIDTHLTMRDVFFSLEDAYKSFFIQFIEKSVKIENIFENEEILEKLPNYDIVIKGDGSGEQYYLFVLNTDLNGILLSFNQGTWVESLVDVCKVEDNNYIDIKLKNIAKKEHAIELLSFEKEALKEEILGKLPTTNIIYSDDFKGWYLSKDISTIEKITTKINQCVSMKFVSDGFLLKKLQDDVWQIRIGTEGGLQESAIRVLFKYDESSIYILWYVEKQGERNYDYSSDIDKANEIFKKIKELEIDEI